MTRTLIVAGAVGAIGASTTSLSSAASSCAAPAPTTAIGWQALNAALPYHGDGNWSVRLADGRSVWVTGDAIPAVGGAWASNTFTVVDRGCTWQTPNFVPDTATGTVFWPGPVAVSGSQVLVVGSRIKRTPGVGFGFTPIGTELRRYTLSGWLPVLAGSRVFSATALGIRWAAGVYVDVTGTYIFGTTDGKPGQWGVDAYVAKLVGAGLAIWNGRTWGGGTPVPILRAADGHGTDTAFSVRRDGTGWHLYTRLGGHYGGQHGEFIGNVGGAWRWVARGSEAGYLAGSHPEVRLASGKLLVTLNVEGAGARFYEVPR